MRQISKIAPCVIAAGIVGLLATAAPQAQQSSQAPRDPLAPVPAARGLIAGTVVTADTGRPLRQVRVSLSGGDVRTMKTVTADDQGRFTFTELPAGQFTLTASRGGWLDVTYGQRRPGSGRPGTPIALTAGQKLERISLAMPRGSVITGTVIDEVGEASFGTSVQAFRYVMRSGARSLQLVRSTTTDDRGIYRIPMLVPGEYVVLALPRDSSGLATEEAKMRAEMVMVDMAKAAAERGVAVEKLNVDLRELMTRAGIEEPVSGYAPVFHPGAMQASGASSVTLDISEERTSVDVRLQVVPFATVSGTVSLDTLPPGGVTVWLSESRDAIPGVGARTARTGPDGRFTFGAIPPGQYVVSAQAVTARKLEGERAGGPLTLARPAETTDPGPQWASSEISVSGGTVPVTLMLRPGVTVSGRVVFESGTGGPADLSKLRVTLAPAGDTVLRGERLPVRDVPVSAEGTFQIAGVLPGKYRVVPSVGVPGGYLIETAMFAGRDTLDIPLEVKTDEAVADVVLTFSRQQSELNGSLTDAAGKPAPNYTLVLFSAQSQHWLPQSRRIQAARPSSDGRFAFRAMPPGEYRLIALEDVEPGQWFDPAFLKDLVTAAMPVSIGRGERRTQDVRVNR